MTKKITRRVRLGIYTAIVFLLGIVGLSGSKSDKAGSMTIDSVPRAHADAAQTPIDQGAPDGACPDGPCW